MSGLPGIRIVAGKELKDAMRDRRAIASVLFGAFIGPILIGVIFNYVARQERSAEEIRVPVSGRENAPLLVNWLEQQVGVELVPGPEKAEEAVATRAHEFVLVISDDFGKRFRESRPAKVRVVSDSTRTSTRRKVQRLRSLLARFSSEIGGLRLINRGVSPSIANALEVDDVEVASGQQRAAMIFGMIPMYIVLAAFIAGMQIATDSTAGERERGSLEPLLVNPISQRDLVVGKWISAMVCAAAAMILTMILISGVLWFVPLQEFGFRFRFGVPEALALASALLPAALIAPAVQMYFATFAKSFKEAQSYMGFLIMAPMLPGLIGTFTPLTGRPYLTPVPILGQYALAAEVLSGKQPPIYLYLVAGAAAALATAGLIAMATGLLRKERIIFGR